MPTLTVLESQDKAMVNRVIPLLRSEVSIGRVHGNTITLADTETSRMHAKISQEPQGWRIEDLKSANSTLVNGTRVKQEWLRHGDQIRVGTTVFSFRDEPATLPIRPDRFSQTAEERPQKSREGRSEKKKIQFPWILAIIVLCVLLAFVIFLLLPRS